MHSKMNLNKILSNCCKLYFASKKNYEKFFNIQIICKLGRLDSRVFSTLDYNKHRYAAPWAVRPILGDDHSFLAQA